MRIPEGETSKKVMLCYEVMMLGNIWAWNKVILLESKIYQYAECNSFTELCLERKNAFGFG